MKKILLLLAFFASVAIAEAQDIIITKDSERIEAQIIEISNDDVRFKRLDNLDGPDFILTAQKVASIVFANGDVFVFKERPKQPERSETGNDHQEDKVSSQLIETLQSSDNQIIASQETRVTYIGSDDAIKSGEDGSSIGFYIGGQKLTNKEYKELTKNTCPEAYRPFKKARIIDNTFTAIAVPAMVAGTAMLLYGEIKYLSGNDKNKGKTYLLAGAGTVAVPLILVLPMHSSSDRLKAKSANIYNQNCGDKMKGKEYSLSVGLAPNGVGFYFNF